MSTEWYSNTTSRGRARIYIKSHDPIRARIALICKFIPGPEQESTNLSIMRNFENKLFLEFNDIDTSNLKHVVKPLSATAITSGHRETTIYSDSGFVASTNDMNTVKAKAQGIWDECVSVDPSLANYEWALYPLKEDFESTAPVKGPTERFDASASGQNPLGKKGPGSRTGKLGNFFGLEKK